MIEPSNSDIGSKVVYTGNRYPGGKLEEGVITSFNERWVLVRYGHDAYSKATSREDLEWMSGARSAHPDGTAATVSRLSD
jgi:hypothetical protein